MSLWTRIANAFAQERLNRELDQELRLHIEEAVAAGRTEAEARRAFGNLLLTRERSRDAKVLGWLEALVADAKFGVRQLRKNWMVSGAAILSLALAIGASTGAFRLIDAVLLRPLPVADPGRTYYASYSYLDDLGVAQQSDSFSYPLYREMRDAVGRDADVLVLGYVSRIGFDYGGGSERAYRQYVSGNVFASFGLRPALGRLLGPADDKPGAAPVVVLSYDYWTSRFGRDPNIVGRSFRYAEQPCQIVGVGPKDFTGTETGSIPGVFMPAVMNPGPLNDPGWQWFRVLVRPRTGLSVDPIRDRLQAVFSAHRRARVKDWGSNTPPQLIEQFLNSKLTLQTAASGASETREKYGRALVILGVLVGLVLLIACVNVANLLAAQAAARSREMALRVSIGAGRMRLVQLVLVESAMIAAAATAIGGLFAWWSAPLVVSMVNPPDDPLCLVLPADWRVLGFAAALAVAVTFLFGLVPALRASAVKPANALRGGDDPRTRLRLIYSLVAAQIAFCFVVHFAASLFVTTFQRLSSQPLGFSPDRVVLLESVVDANKKQAPEVWRQVAERLGGLPGVESAGICGWPLMSGNGWSGGVRIPGKNFEAFAPYFLGVSPGFLSTLGIELLAGRDFKPADVQGSAPGVGPAGVANSTPADPHGATRGRSTPGVAIVSEAFARRYFNGQNPVGKFFERTAEKDQLIRIEIVGLVRDVRYRTLREPMLPVIFVPADQMDWGTFAVRVSGATDPLLLAPAFRQEVTRVRSDFHVVATVSQRELVNQWSIRERLLATLSLFFAGLALLLAAIGLYGVLNYSVLRRTREIGIRMALGAPTRHVMGSVTGQVFAVFALGAAAGLAAGLASERLLENLLYGVKTTDAAMIATPLVLLLGTALLAAIPPAIMAVRIDPARALRAE